MVSILASTFVVSPAAFIISTALYSASMELAKPMVVSPLGIIPNRISGFLMARRMAEDAMSSSSALMFKALARHASPESAMTPLRSIIARPAAAVVISEMCVAANSSTVSV